MLGIKSNNTTLSRRILFYSSCNKYASS